MKILLFLFCLLNFMGGSHSQEINWYTTDSGGGMVTYNDIELLGVIGQTDTAQMSGGEIVLSGGYLPQPVDNDLIFKDSFE